MQTFILNDENQVNCYGFRVKNAGIDLARFNANPVMLDEHYASTATVIGKWLNIRIDGSLLKADAEFDVEDEYAKKVAGKVERGFIKGASIGFLFNKDAIKLAIDGIPELWETELMEASICAIPASATSVKLYASDNQKLMTQDDVKLSLSAINSQNFPNNNPMKKINLTIAALAALGLKEAPSEDETAPLSSAIEGLKVKLDASEQARLNLQKTVDDAAEARANDLVANAVKEGRLTADQKDTYLKLAKSDYQVASDIIGGLPAKASLSTMVNNSTNSNSAAQLAAKGREEWTYMDWAKKDSKGLNAMRINEPEKFAALQAK